MSQRSSLALSKSRYLSGLQCALKLWYDGHGRAYASEITASAQHLFDVGKEVGELARQRHPGGVEVTADHLHHEDGVAKTGALMADPSVPAIFEAAFTIGSVRTRVDILARNGSSAWDLIEVKSTLAVKDPHIDDVAIQYWVLTEAGLKVRNAGVLTLNKDHIYRGGAYDVSALFAWNDRTEWLRSMQKAVSGHVEEFLRVLNQPEAPVVAPGDQCFDPYTCPYYEHCTKGLVVPEHPVDELPSFLAERKQRLQALGVSVIKDIPEDFNLTALQSRVRRAVIEQRPYVSRGLKKALAEPVAPIHHLDFETFMLALPRYAGTHPYQVLPFQWSNHIESASGEVRHEEFLCSEDIDPRPAFAASLLDSLGDVGTICIYTPYERRIVNELAATFPELAPRFEALESRFWDLCALIKDHYYDPDFRGSFSLKKVLPVLVPGMGYSELEIQDGDAASREYFTAVTSKDPSERKRILDALLTYCGQDTLALVRLRQALRKQAEST